MDSGFQSSTIRSYASAIKSVLKTDGYPWDEGKFFLTAIIRGCKLKNDVVRTRLPIQMGLLELILFEIQRIYNKDGSQFYLECMYLSLFAMAYYGLFRVGELTLGTHTLKACNVHIAHNKNKILAVLYSSKTHGKESRPQKIKITGLDDEAMIRKCETSRGINRHFCPFTLIRQYMEMRGNFDDNVEPFYVFRDGSPVKTNTCEDTPD